MADVEAVGGGSGDMKKAVYDPNADGVIALAQTEARYGDMEKTVFDANDNGEVDTMEGISHYLKDDKVGTAIPAHSYDKVASDVLRNSHDAQCDGDSVSALALMKTITLTNGLKGVLRTKFDLSCSSGINSVWAQVYRNGVAIGTLQTENAGYVTKTEDLDFGTMAAGDTIELWGRKGSCIHVRVRNFRLCYSNAGDSVAVAAVNS